MAELVVVENVTLDGVMQAPGRADEDTRDGFTAGGWAAPYADPVAMEQAGKGMSTSAALLLGRRTYLDFHGFWPKQTDGNPFTKVLDEAPKYVMSRTLTDLPWQNSTRLSDLDEVAAVKERLPVISRCWAAASWSARSARWWTATCCPSTRSRSARAGDWRCRRARSSWSARSRPVLA